MIQLLIATLLLISIGPVAILFALVKNITSIKSINRYMLDIAYAIDQSGNVIGQHLFNATLIRKGGTRFGNPDETISSVLGKNLLKNKLTTVGKILSKILDAIEKNHTIKYIESDEK